MPQLLPVFLPFDGAKLLSKNHNNIAQYRPIKHKRIISKQELEPFIFILFTRHSLVERRARYLVYCMFVCLFVCLFIRSTISQQPAGRFTPYFACGRSLGRDVSSPLLGVGGPRRAEKEANEIFVTMGVNGEFLHFGGF